MAQTAEDTQREVEAIRGDASAAVAELQSRLRGGPTALLGARDRSVNRVRSEPRPVEGVLRVVRESTVAMGVLAAMALGALGFVLYFGLEQRRARRKPYNRLLRRARATRERVAERAIGARHELDKWRARGILVKVEQEGGGHLRMTHVRLG
jgi:hypothetical protein